MKKTALISIALLLVVIVAYFVADRWRTTAHRIPIPGHAEKTVDFIRTRAMSGERGYIVGISSDFETKEVLVTNDVSVGELRNGSRVEYVDRTLTIYGPRGNCMKIPGYVP